MSKVQKLVLVLYFTLSAMAYPSICPLFPSEISVYAQGYSEGTTTSSVSLNLTEQDSESVFNDDVSIFPDSDDSSAQGDNDDIHPYPPTAAGADYGGQGDDDDIRPYPPTPTVTPTVNGG